MAAKQMSCLGFLGLVIAMFGTIIGAFVAIWVFGAKPWDEQMYLKVEPDAYVTSIDTAHLGPNRGSSGYLLRYIYTYEGRLYLDAGTSTSENFDYWAPGDPAPDDVCIDPHRPEQYSVMEEDEFCGEGHYSGGTSEAELFVPEPTTKTTVTVDDAKPFPPRRGKEARRDPKGYRVTFTYRHPDPHDQNQRQEYLASVRLPSRDWRPNDPLTACIDPDEPAVHVLLTGEVTTCGDTEGAEPAVATAQLYPDDDL